LSISAGASGIISGYVIEDIGWQCTYKLAAIFVGVLFPPLVFFCPETAYTRSADLNIDLATINHANEHLRWNQGPRQSHQVILRPFPMPLFSQGLYAFITYGLSTSWLIVLGSVSALMFGSPPYNMSVGEIGLLQIAGLTTSLLGFVAGPINDYLCKRLARRNNGTYESEVSHFKSSSLTLG
jgi:hypothetical protein